MKELLELPDEVDERDAENPADLAQFEQIEPSRSGFVIANKCLWLAECACHVNLAKASLDPELAEQG